LGQAGLFLVGLSSDGPSFRRPCRLVPAVVRVCQRGLAKARWRTAGQELEQEPLFSAEGFSCSCLLLAQHLERASALGSLFSC